MASVNKVILIGNLGADPEVRYTPGGQAVANFRIACSDNWTDKSGQRQERTEWVRIVAWGKTAELCGEYLSKGRQVYVEGRLQTREWTDKENRRQWTTEVVANQVVFLSAGAGGGRRDEFGQPPVGYDAPGSEMGATRGGEPDYGGRSQGGDYQDDGFEGSSYGRAPQGGGNRGGGSQSQGYGGRAQRGDYDDGGSQGGGPNDDDIPF